MNTFIIDSFILSINSLQRTIIAQFAGFFANNLLFVGELFVNKIRRKRFKNAVILFYCPHLKQKVRFMLCRGFFANNFVSCKP